MCAVDSALDTAAAAGWLVNNLYQIADGQWRCNLRRNDQCTGYGVGRSAAEALRNAMQQETVPAIRPVREIKLDLGDL